MKLHTHSVLMMVAVLAAAGAVASNPRPEAQYRVAAVTLTGRVLSASSGAPVVAASIAVAGTPLRVLSGSDGTYRLVIPTGAAPGSEVRLQVSRIGFQSTEIRVRVISDIVTTDILLSEQSLLLDAIAATGLVEASRGGVTIAPTTIAPTTFTPAAFGPAARSRAVPGPDWSREQYAHIAENDFLDPGFRPLSTFSIDVDRASYSNVRRFLREGRLPPVDAVQIEEMVNYFPYDYPRPSGSDPIAISTEVGAAPWRSGHLLLRIGLASTPIHVEELPPNNLVFLIDVSGSMGSPDKLPLVKRSLRMLVNELRAEDRVAMVVYAGAAGLVLPSTPGSRKGEILEAIERLDAGGSTAGGAGLRLAYAVAREYHMPQGNNRIILATDGDFNIGESSDSEMIRLVEERRQQGTYLTVLGFGTGNLQSEKMQSMAQHGNGNYAYIDSPLEARKVLVGEMGGTLVTVAQDVKLQVEFNPALVSAYRLIGYENRLLAAEDFNDDAKDAGELGAGHVVTALYEIVPTGADTGVETGNVDPLRYSRASDGPVGAPASEIAFVRVRYKNPGVDESQLLEHAVGSVRAATSADFRFAAAVAGFGMLLRESEHRGSVTSDHVLELARGGVGGDPFGYRADFVRLVERYRYVAGEEVAP